MALPLPRIDHLVIDVRDRLDEAVKAFSSLGFQLTPRSRHTIGSMNQLAVFDSDYLELLGFDREAPAPRSDITRFPVGMNGLVFAADQADSLFSALQSSGIPVEEPAPLARTLNLPTGSREARFCVVRLPAGSVSLGRVYFCQHLTPELVWRHEWQQHPNAAIGIRRVTIAVRDARASVAMFRQMFGPNSVREGPHGMGTLTTRDALIEFIPREEVARRLADASPDPAGRDDYMASVTLGTRSLSQAADALHLGGVKFRREPHRICVPAIHAMNVALEFVE